MTKTNTRSTSHKPQHSGSPRKTQLIKFRVTPEEKRDLEIMCEILHVNMSTPASPLLTHQTHQANHCCHRRRRRCTETSL